MAQPLVIAHRGASGYRPEHTLAAYELAISMGADYVEPDLVSTRDGVLVARHENEISGTTDVADHPEFAGRFTTRWIDGRRTSGWFTEDFTLAELKTLRAEERLPGLRPANTRYDGRFEIPTFAEVLDLVRREGSRRGRIVGVYPETKHPTYFAGIGLPLEEPLVADLERAHRNRCDAQVFVQSFETASLRTLAHLSDVPLVQLLDRDAAPYDLVAAGDPRTCRELTTPWGLREISTYAAGIGPAKDLVLAGDAGGGTGRPCRLVGDAHDAGLSVHVYTLRAENRFLTPGFRRGSAPGAWGNAFAECAAFFDAGVDGVFSDHTDVAVAARTAWLGTGAPTPTLTPTRVPVAG